MTWPHNGQKNFFRFFGVRISQFEKINEIFFSKILISLQKILSLRSRDLIKGKNRVKIFLLHFWNQNDSIRKKKANFFVVDFLTLGDWPYDVIRMECAPIKGQWIFGRRVDLYSSKGIRAIFWKIFSKIHRLKLEQYQKGSFLTPKIPHISAPTFFFENRALLLVINFTEESLCKKI